MWEATRSHGRAGSNGGGKYAKLASTQEGSTDEKMTVQPTIQAPGRVEKLGRARGRRWALRALRLLAPPPRLVDWEGSGSAQEGGHMQTPMGCWGPH